MTLDQPVLVLFCKKPAPGRGKQRLAKDIGIEKTFEFAQSFLHCALTDLSQWPGPKVLAPSHESELIWAQELATSDYFLSSPPMVLPQPEGNLGTRLNSIDRSLRQLGAKGTVFMPSDAPSLDVPHFAGVAKGLQQNDVVLADDLDGGVTLMGSRVPWPDLQTLPWSTAELADSLSALCQSGGLSVERVEGGFDVDNVDDLMRLNGMLHRDQRPSRRGLCKLLQEKFEHSE